MATTAKQHGATPFETAFEQIKDSGDQFAAVARKAGNAYLDGYDKAVDRAIEFELKVAGMTQQEWLKGLLEAQADFARELASSYTTTARSLLK